MSQLQAQVLGGCAPLGGLGKRAYPKVGPGVSDRGRSPQGLLNEMP